MKIETVIDVDGNKHILVWANEREYESMPKAVYEERLAAQSTLPSNSADPAEKPKK
jgi:hypothetical protein